MTSNGRVSGCVAVGVENPHLPDRAKVGAARTLAAAADLYTSVAWVFSPGPAPPRPPCLPLPLPLSPDPDPEYDPAEADASPAPAKSSGACHASVPLMPPDELEWAANSALACVAVTAPPWISETRKVQECQHRTHISLPPKTTTKIKSRNWWWACLGKAKVGNLAPHSSGHKHI